MSSVSERIFLGYYQRTLKWKMFYKVARDTHIDNSNETHTLCVWAEPTVLDSTKTALKFNYEI